MPEPHAIPWYYEVEKAGDTHVYAVFNDAAYLVCVTYTKAQAEFICRACNAHEALMESLNAMRLLTRRVQRYTECENVRPAGQDKACACLHCHAKSLENKVEAALAAAEAE